MPIHISNSLGVAIAPRQVVSDCVVWKLSDSTTGQEKNRCKARYLHGFFATQKVERHRLGRLYCVNYLSHVEAPMYI